jgi:iron-sulfur cluster repair protein YtfE (RIC family)
MGRSDATDRTRVTGERAAASQECSLFTQTLDALSRHKVLRGQLERAAELADLAVIEQKPPLCHVLLPVRRLFQEFRSELESYIELEESDLFPKALAHSGCFVAAKDLPETVRLLMHGQDTLLRLLAEMCEVTGGFQTPGDPCQSYAELLEVLRAIQTELVWECLESEVLFPRALSYAAGFDGQSWRHVC